VRALASGVATCPEVVEDTLAIIAPTSHLPHLPQQINCPQEYGMKSFDAAHVRNVALVSHGGAGKTSLVEAMLFKAGAIGRLGSVEEGTTTSDFDPDEVKRHSSVTLSLAPLEWRETKINLLDTPGYADFFGEVASGLRPADAAVIVVDGVSGVQVGTDAVWRKADERSLPRLVFVNKLERENASFAAVLEMLRTRYGTKVVPLVVPIGSEQSFKGVVDLITRRAIVEGAGTDVPPDMATRSNACARCSSNPPASRTTT
jgi:elongation factor G